MMALMMFNRARFTNKPAEAEIFRQWLADRLAEAKPEATRMVSLREPKRGRRRKDA